MTTILGTNGSDTKDGTDLADTLYGFDGDDELSGKKGNDLFIGGTGNDRLHGGDGDDTFVGGPFDGLYGQGTDGQGDDTFYGDGGFDTVSYANVGHVIVHLGNGHATNSAIGHDTLVGIDHVIGSYEYTYGDLLIGREDDWLGYQGDDQLEGLAGPDSLYGRGGDDYLLGGTENDLLSGDGDDDRLAGGDGDDWLDGGDGDDYLSGGAGTDTASYVNAAGDIFVFLHPAASGYHNGLHDGDGGEDTLVSIENLYGSRYNDFLGGSSAANKLSGQDGGDHLEGGEGNDTLDGGAGQDALWGDSGADTLTGGRDFVDEFFFRAGDSGVGAGHRDVITDFQDGYDAISLYFMDGAQDVPGEQAFSFVGTAAFTAEAQVRQTVEAGNTVVQGNTDTDTAPEFEIQLQGLHTLSSVDFLSL